MLQENHIKQLIKYRTASGRTDKELRLIRQVGKRQAPVVPLKLQLLNRTISSITIMITSHLKFISDICNITFLCLTCLLPIFCTDFAFLNCSVVGQIIQHQLLRPSQIEDR